MLKLYYMLFGKKGKSNVYFLVNHLMIMSKHNNKRYIMLAIIPIIANDYVQYIIVIVI